MRIWIKHYKRNKFQFVPGYREEENNHFAPMPAQNQPGRRNSTKKRRNSKSQARSILVVPMPAKINNKNLNLKQLGTKCYNVSMTWSQLRPERSQQ